MRIFTLTLSLALVLPSAAQITIGPNEMPHAGDALTRVRATPNPLLNYAATGAGHVWNFANLNAASDDAVAYQTVASTNFVYALTFADIFFNPNRANHARPGLDIAFNEILPVEDPYSFFHVGADAYKKVGYGMELAGLPIPVLFSEQDVIYELPLNYGDAGTHHSAWEIGLPTLAHYGYEQERHNEVDGWGTITTPGGTFEALRVKTSIAGRDTIHVDTLSLGFTIDRPMVREYKWLATGIRVPVLQVNTMEVFGFEVVTEIFFHAEPRTLLVQEPQPLMLCLGADNTVTYAATGAFNPGGFLNPGNNFRVQLSDMNGDFTNAVVIGAVQSTTSGSITVNIPDGTPAGTGYRIRVVSTNPVFIGEDNGQDLTIGTAPEATIGAEGDLMFCEGGSVLLSTAAAGTASFQWQRDGIDLEDATTAELTAEVSGSYGVIVTNACGSDASEVLTVLVNEAPAHTLSPTVLLCADSTATIVAENTSGQSDLDYQWSLDGTAIEGAILPELTLAAGGAYTLEVTNPTTGCVYAAGTQVTIDPIHTSVPVITSEGPLSFCAGGSVELALSVPLDLQAQWYLDGVAIPGADQDLLLVAASGSYTGMVISLSGCPSQSSTATEVTVHPLPAAPVITEDFNTLSTTAVGDLQWYLDGEPIEGATEAEIVVTVNGTYTVSIIDANGCSSTSGPYAYTSVGIDQVIATTIQVSPNPSKGVFTIEVPKGAMGMRVEIMDATGQVVRTGSLVDTRTTFDMQTAAAGLYFLRLMRAGEVRVERLILE
jgi:hypothetical protein